MPDEQSIWERFRKAILESPDDDPPRLAFAAALEEEEDGNVRHPREQATFIRTQLKLARIHAGHPEWLALSAREQLLLNRYGGDWLPIGFRQSAVSEARYFRGFVSHLTLRAFASVDFNPQVLQETPIEHIDIIGIDQTFTFESTLNWLAESGLSDRIRSLALDAQELSDRDAKLLTTIGFPRLKWLSLTDNKIGQSGVAVLIERFRNLRFVDLDGNPGDPHDTFEYDQGIVIERVPGRVSDNVPEASWLHPRVRGGRVVYPSRYRIVRPRNAGQFQEI
jgi:uncharacterized protein (TIGR02996 family)